MYEADRWRRSREADVYLLGITIIANRMPHTKRPVDLEKVLRMIPWYEE